MMFQFLSNLREAISPAPIPKWIQLAKREVGVREIRGGENPRVIEYHATCTLKATEDEVAWCSAFMNWVMMKCGLERSHSAAARSWLGYGTRLKSFRKYCIVVIRRGNSSWQGHVFFGMELKNGRIRALGGNQSDSVNDTAWFRESDVLGYIWPKEES